MSEYGFAHGKGMSIAQIRDYLKKAIGHRAGWITASASIVLGRKDFTAAITSLIDLVSKVRRLILGK